MPSWLENVASSLKLKTLLAVELPEISETERVAHLLQFQRPEMPQIKLWTVP